MAVTTASGLVNRKRIERITSNVSWTVPAGVYAIEVVAVGGGAGRTMNNNGGAGGNTTVTESGGAVITGVGAASALSHAHGSLGGGNAQANSGQAPSAYTSTGTGTVYHFPQNARGDAIPMSGTLAVSPGSTVAVVIGSGGTGTRTGGSGNATIRWEV